MAGIVRYEPLIHRADREEIKEANFASCKNDCTLILPNSPFIIPYLTSDKNRHQEEN